MRILHFTDAHLRASCPAGRNGNFFDDMISKVKSVSEIAKQYSCDLTAFTGDLFDRWNPSFPVFNAALNVAQAWPTPVVCVPGQHDLVGHSMDAYGDTALRALIVGAKQWSLGAENVRSVAYTDSFFQVLTNPEITTPEPIAIVHAMVVKDPVPWPHISIREVALQSRVILCGDYHAGFGIVEDHGRLFINPGALARLSRKESDRVPQVAIIDMDENYDVTDARLVPVPYRKDAFYTEFDRTPVERSISEFALMLSGLQRDESTPAERLLSGEIIKGVDPSVVAEARKRVKEAQRHVH